MEKFWTLKEGPRRIKARFWTTLHEIWKRRKKPFERLQEFGESSKDAKFGQIHGRKKKHQKYGFWVTQKSLDRKVRLTPKYYIWKDGRRRQCPPELCTIIYKNYKKKKSANMVVNLVAVWSVHQSVSRAGCRKMVFNLVAVWSVHQSFSRAGTWHHLKAVAAFDPLETFVRQLQRVVHRQKLRPLEEGGLVLSEEKKRQINGRKLVKNKEKSREQRRKGAILIPQLSSERPASYIGFGWKKRPSKAAKHQTSRERMRIGFWPEYFTRGGTEPTTHEITTTPQHHCTMLTERNGQQRNWKMLKRRRKNQATIKIKDNIKSGDWSKICSKLANTPPGKRKKLDERLKNPESLKLDHDRNFDEENRPKNFEKKTKLAKTLVINLLTQQMAK